MRFFVLHEGYYEGLQARIDLFNIVCKSLRIEFISIDSLKADYTKLPGLGKRDLFYNLSRGSSYCESLLINKEVSTFYINTPDIAGNNSDTIKYAIIHSKHQLAQPKTIFNITNARNLLKSYVDYVGGFPLIIKSAGSTRGIGTIKIESWQNLISTVDYLVTTPDTFVIREFIHADYGARVMVLGNEVILTKKFYFQENDFRNAPILSATHYEPMEIDEHTKQLCISAVHLVNLEMAGVDLLFEKETGKPYLLEINFPTGFQSFMDDPQPILTKMIRHLINKANRHD